MRPIYIIIQVIYTVFTISCLSKVVIVTISYLVRLMVKCIDCFFTYT